MKLSVIIPCKNEVGTVDALLECLRAQTRLPDEVVIVDSHSTDGTARHVKEIAQELPLTILTATKRGVAEARNTGGRAATSELLLFLDADSKLPNDFIERFLREQSKRNFEAGGFTQRMPSAEKGLEVGARAMNGYARLMSKTPWPIAFSAVFSTREVFDTLGGFDPEIFIMEDYDYVYRARKTGYKVGTITVPFIASDRRYVGTNKPPLWQGVYAELYRYTHGMRITKPLFEYKMGGDMKKTK